MKESCKNILIFLQKAVFQLLKLCGHPVLTLHLVQVMSCIPLPRVAKYSLLHTFVPKLSFFTNKNKSSYLFRRSTVFEADFSSYFYFYSYFC